MALQTPLVLISGAFSSLPPGDTIGPATDTTAQASGNAALVLAGTALASGNAGISTGLTALASGNAGLVSASNKVPISGGYMTGQLFAASGVVVSGTLSRNGFNVVTVGDVETVTSTMIASGTIIDADVNISGAINATKLRFLQAGTSAVARTVDSKLKDTVSVLDFGADPTGATDSTAAFQAALNAAKGADNTAIGRSVFSLYIPTVAGGFYRITDTLVIDGTYGLHLFGDGAYVERDKYAIRWYGATRKPIFQIKGQTGAISNPNFMIKIEALNILGYTSEVVPGSIPANMALSAIHIGNIDGYNDNSLMRCLVIDRVAINSCRFGIWGGNPDAMNTDHALVSITNSFIYNCPQAGISWGTGNALASLIGNSIYSSGYDITFPADAYQNQVGANIIVNSGYVDIISNVSAGAGTTKPNDADILQQSGRVSIINAWSDTHGYFFRQTSASQNAGAYQCGQITGVRHYDGAMTTGNTPNSIEVVCPGTTINSCMLFGNLVISSGLGTRPVVNGVNFVGASTITGTGVATFRSLVLQGNLPNFGQTFYGGVNSGQSYSNLFGINTHLLMKGDSPGILEVSSAAASGASFAWLSRTDDANGGHSWYYNCYYQSGSFYPQQNTKACWKLEFFINVGFRIYVADPNGSSGALTFVDAGGWLSAPLAGYRSAMNFQPPQLAANPTFDSGNFWLGGMYFNTTTNKLRVNVGSMTWQDCN